MSYSLDRYYGETAAAPAPVNARVAFIKRTYIHLAAAMFAFVGIEAGLFMSGLGEEIIKNVFVMRGAWIGLMLLFVVGGMVAQQMALGSRAPAVQYAGLTLYVLLESAIFLPLLTIASSPRFGGSPMLPFEAGVVTLAVFGALTVAVFVSGRDFSFMGPFLCVASVLALVGIVLAVIFGVSIGLGVCVLLVGLTAGWIIYQTSNVIHQYGTNQHVAASLFLFASIATLFWYVIQIFMLSRDD
jgi:FtsH-binding integral membrane protein